MSLDLTLKNREFNFKVTNFSRHKVYEFEDFRLDAAHKLLYRSGTQVSLTPKAVETLIALVERRGEVVAKDELMEQIWADTIVEESNLAQYLHILRKTLGNASDGKPYIETLKRRGYRFNSIVRVSENSGGFAQPQMAGSRNLRPERRGNVLALADWRKRQEHVVKIDGEENIHNRANLFTRHGFRVYAAAAVALLGVFFLAAFTSNWFSSVDASIDREVRKGDLTIVPLTSAEIVGQATISPDGKYFAYTEYDAGMSRIWLQTVGESSRVEAVKAPFDRIQNLSFTPDSTAVYFTGWNTGSALNSLFRVGALGGVPTKVADGLLGPVSFSPNGDQIVFVSDDPRTGRAQIVTAAADGTGQMTLLPSTDPDIIRPNVAWSPDGKSIAFGLQSQEKSVAFCSIVTVDPATAAVKPVSTEKWDNCHRMVWTRDGSGLVFIGTKFSEALTTRRDQIYYLDVATSDARRLTTDGSLHEPMSLGITIDDEIVAVPYKRVSQIWSLDAGSNVQTARQITSGQHDGKGGVEVMPDGNIAFLSRSGDGFGIFIVKADGPEERKEIISDPTMEELRAAPDGSFVVFAAKIGGYGHIFRADTDGTNRRQLTFGESNQVDSAISPDGRWIVYESIQFDGERYRYSLRKVSSDGGNSLTLVSESCSAPHFSFDGKIISCISGDNIRLLSAENGQPVGTLKSADLAILNTGARFTPDGQSLVYRVSQKSGSNLWQQPVGGGKGRLLTDFSTGEVYNFAFASDSSRVYLARGSQLRNAILINNFK